MASLFTHAIAGATLGLSPDPRIRRKPAFWLAVLLGSSLPDVDVIGFSLGIHYGDLWGHRGMTHSLLFAAIVAFCMAAYITARDRSLTSPTGSRQSARNFLEERVRLILLFFVIVASHGVLDALTNGGLGVAFFSPFDTTRYFFPWRPIRVSPIGTGAFFTGRGWLVLQSEILWVWIPALAIVICISALRWSRQHRARKVEQH
jgi:inner membrane protein